ncbi:MAG: penicillin-binding protein 2 [Sporolactobacillus sp.]
MKEAIKSKETKNNVPLRLNLIFLVVFLAFAGLIIRLGYVQIVNGAHYKKLMTAHHYQTASIDSARGRIVDTNGTVLADNNAELAIVFVRNAGLDQYKCLKIAQELSGLLTLDDKTLSQITERDEREYYLLTHYKTLSAAYQTLFSKSEQNKLQKNATKEYKAALARLPKNVLTGFNDQDRQIIALMHQFNQASNLNPYVIKRGLQVNDPEYVRVVDHLSEFNGAIQTADVSSRNYISNAPFYIGHVGEIPADDLNGFLSKGYSRNAIVGVSDLEQQYESYLRGVPMKLIYRTKSGVPTGNPTVKAGQRGDDIRLTIDWRLQQDVNQILQANVLSARSQLGNQQNDSAYAVVMNARTGAILALGGQVYKNGKFTDDAEATVDAQFEMGSAVKGATELTGYRYGAVPESFTDKAIQYPGGKEFTSWESNTGLGTLTPEQALEFSSNVFMAKIVSNMAGIKLTPGGPGYIATLPLVTNSKFVQAVHDLRNGYNQVGLGVKTGIDLPTEGTGYNGGMPDNPGLIHQFAIGQFDTYTPLEMAQYIATIANGGNRVQPHLLQSVHAPSDDPNALGSVLYSFKTNVLNRIDNSTHDLQRVQNGLYLVTHGEGLATGKDLGNGPNAVYKIAAKTGTAQIDPNNLNLYNETLVSYAPYDNPQIVVVDIVPKVEKGHENHQIALSIYQAYDSMYHYTTNQTQ